MTTAAALTQPVLRSRCSCSGRRCSRSRSPATSRVAWLLVEATTAASALLVAFSGRRDALEAGWKYLVLTTLGLSVALLGIVVLAIGQAQRRRTTACTRSTGTRCGSPLTRCRRTRRWSRSCCCSAGLATKIGWAPVHNWLPDAHSEAPPPVSALLSRRAAADRAADRLARQARSSSPSVGAGTTRAVLRRASASPRSLVAVPFLWRSLPWKRLLAYSSLEHMGVIALGIGFGTPLAIAGVVLHVAGHALAKALGFYAAMPLLRIDPTPPSAPPTGVAGASPTTAAAMGVSLGALAGLPPSPLFLSELLIVLGGVAAGQLVVSRRGRRSPSHSASSDCCTR